MVPTTRRLTLRLIRSMFEWRWLVLACLVLCPERVDTLCLPERDGLVRLRSSKRNVASVAKLYEAGPVMKGEKERETYHHNKPLHPPADHSLVPASEAPFSALQPSLVSHH